MSLKPAPSADQVLDSMAWSNISFDILRSSMKLSGLAEVMQGFVSQGSRSSFGRAEHSHLEYSHKIVGLGELLMDVAGDLAHLHHRMENGRLTEKV